MKLNFSRPEYVCAGSGVGVVGSRRDRDPLHILRGPDVTHRTWPLTEGQL